MPDRVMVFAPAPQLTITLESAPDDIEIHLHAGGQGFWQARMIQALGVEVTLCCALGGETGRVLRTLIAAEGVHVAALEVTARNGAYLHDRRTGSRVEIAHAPGHALSRHELDNLYGMAVGHGLNSSLSLLSGVAPERVASPAMYQRLAGDLRRNGLTVMADLSGDYLDAVLRAGLDLVKVSDEELVAGGRARTNSPAALTAAMRQMRAAGAKAVIVSRAHLPALALCGNQPMIEVVAPRLEPVDSAGAGDSMTAAIAAVLAGGGDMPTALRTGAAAGALNVTRRGLGTGDASAIEKLARLIRLETAAEEVEVVGETRMTVSDMAEDAKW